MGLWYTKISNNTNFTYSIYEKMYTIVENVCIYKNSYDDEYHICDYNSGIITCRRNITLYRINKGVSFKILGLYNRYSCIDGSDVKCYVKFDTSLKPSDIEISYKRNSSGKIIATKKFDEISSIKYAILDMYNLFSYTDGSKINTFNYNKFVTNESNCISLIK